MAGRRGNSAEHGRDELVPSVGQRVRRRRLQRGYTLAGMSARTGLSKGYLSRIENGRKLPPLDTLQRLARALGTDLAILLSSDPCADLASTPTFSVVRAAQRARTSPPEDACGYACRQLVAADVGCALRPYLLQLPTGVDEHMFFAHDGQEFMFVLEGRIAWMIGTECIVLEPGDALLLDSRIEHHARAVDGPAQALVVFAPQRGQADPGEGWHCRPAPGAASGASAS